ncbi:MAG: response regulator [Proteobacteria bacterium]|nr:response regulator [Pseudomonadota bacterium]
MTDQKTMLIVDDSRVSRILIRKFAGDANSGWCFLEAENGDDALTKARGRDIDLMTLDFHMPGMNGLELGALLREQFPHAHMTLLTANVQRSILEKASNVGMSVMHKPITQDKIRNYLAQST